jgi:hypothetical protein
MPAARDARRGHHPFCACRLATGDLRLRTPDMQPEDNLEEFQDPAN